VRAVSDLNEISTIARGETARALKGGRVVVLAVLFLLFTALALSIVGYFNYQMNAQVKLSGGDPDAMAQGGEQNLSGKKQFLSFVFTNDPQLLDALAALPLVLLVVFKLAMRFLPLFVALMGFDQISGEVGPKSIRYLVVRVKRSSIVAGKFVAQGLVLAGLLLLSTLAMVGVAKWLNADFGWSFAATTALKLVGASLALAVAYLGLSTLCSAVTRQASVSLAANIILLFVIWFLAFLGEAFRLPGQQAAMGTLEQLKSESGFAYLRFASVWHYGEDLLHPHLPRFFGAALVHVGWACIFLGLANLMLRRRDL